MQLTEANLCGSDSPKFIHLSLKVCAIIDGEIVCLDEKGISQFNWLLSDDRPIKPSCTFSICFG